MSNQANDVPAASQAAPTPGQPVRSEALLPADQDDPNLQVAEEVAFDLQSDESRRVGAMPADTPGAKAAGAVAESLQPEEQEKSPGQPLEDALDGAVPPSP